MIYKFSDLASSPLQVDAIYEGGNAGNAGDDPISKVLQGTGNQGGFRLVGKQMRKWIVLYTSGEDPDWPDFLDTLTGHFTYYGDNKNPGENLLSKLGNKELARIFNLLHNANSHHEIPPIFVFKKKLTNKSSRSVQFLGIAVPGSMKLRGTEDLTSIWKSNRGQRFQNFKAIFTILNIPHISRREIENLTLGKSFLHENEVWSSWIQKKKYIPLSAEPTRSIRTPEEQEPITSAEEVILKTVWDYFNNTDKEMETFLFEQFAAWVFSLTDTRIVIDEITRSTIDGGRDAVGRYKLGLPDDPIVVNFALEAKLFNPGINGKKRNSVGVKETSRLISRLLHRQFGVLVTTSIVAKQAYEEIRKDKHPIILICGGDIAKILISKGINTEANLLDELYKQFPKV